MPWNSPAVICLTMPSTTYNFHKHWTPYPPEYVYAQQLMVCVLSTMQTTTVYTTRIMNTTSTTCTKLHSRWRLHPRHVSSGTSQTTPKRNMSVRYATKKQHGSREVGRHIHSSPLPLCLYTSLATLPTYMISTVMCVLWQWYTISLQLVIHINYTLLNLRYNIKIIYVHTFKLLCLMQKAIIRMCTQPKVACV